MSNTTKEVLPGFRGLFSCEQRYVRGLVVADADGNMVAKHLDEHVAHALCRVLNSHLAVVEACELFKDSVALAADKKRTNDDIRAFRSRWGVPDDMPISEWTAAYIESALALATKD